MYVMNANSISTRGIPYGATPISTVGFIYYVTIEEEKRTTGPGGRGFREEKKKDHKVIVVTVYAYGKEWKTEHVVNKSINVKAEDIDIVEKDGEIIEISINNLHKTS